MGLTPTQQQFLDKYIREHRISRGKKNEAKKYARRRDKIVAEIGAIPAFLPEHDQYKKALDAPDKKADVGDFKGAYKDLEQVKNNIRAFTSAYDPSADLAQLKQSISTFAAKATGQLANTTAIAAWAANQAQAKLAQVVPIPAANIPDRANYPSVKEWADEMKRVVAAKTDELKQQVAAFYSDFPEAESKDIDKFVRNANSEVEAIKTKARQLAQGCRTPQAQAELRRIAGAAGKLSAEILQNPALAPLRSAPNAQDFCNPCGATKATLSQQLTARVDAVKKQLQQLNEAINSQLTADQKGRDRSAPTDPSRDYADSTKEQLADEQLQDALHVGRTGESKRKVERKEPSPLPKFALAAGYAVPFPTGPMSPADITNNTDLAKNNFLQYLDDKGIDPNGEAVFDLVVKQSSKLKKEFLDELLKARNLKADNLAPHEQQWLDVMTDGMLQAIDEISPAKLDQAAGTLDLGGEQYGNPVHLGKGGAGSVTRYESTTSPGKYVAVKTLNSQSDEAYQDMVKELKAHRHLMQGDPDARGREHVVEMMGVAKGSDGSLNMIMEVLDGGDLEENRMGGVIASETGALSEEARALLNQYQMKQAIEGMIYMRDRNMMHFDLKPENMFMTADGTVKIADFGTGEISRKKDGSIPKNVPRGYTPGYRAESDIIRNAKEDDRKAKLDHKYDVFSLGATAGVLHSKEGSPNLRTNRWNDTLIGDDFSGAFGRLFKGMTEKKSEDRTTLEAALESSYFKNLEAIPEEDIKKLGQLSTEYGKLAKKQLGELQRLLASRRPDLVDLLKSMYRDPASFTFKGVMQTLTMSASDDRRKITKLSDELRKATDDAKKFDLQKQIAELEAGINKLQEVLRSVESPEMKELGAEMRALSDRMTRPTSSLIDTDEAFDQVLRQLESTLAEPAKFANYVSLPSMVEFFDHCGVKHAQVVKAAAFYGLDMSAKNSVANLQFVNAYREIKKLLAGVPNKEAQKLLGKGFKGILDELRKQYDKAHPDKKIDLKKDFLEESESLEVEEYEENFAQSDAKPDDPAKASPMKGQIKNLGILKDAVNNPEKFLAALAKVAGDKPAHLLSAKELEKVNKTVDACTQAIVSSDVEGLKDAIFALNQTIKKLKQAKVVAPLMRKALIESVESKLAELVG